MTDRQWAFCRQYVKQGLTNATGAYQHAYPNCKSDHAAESASSRLMKNGKVSAYLAEVKEKASEKTQITADRVLEELGVVAFTEVPESDVKASDKVSALEKIGKHFGMFTDRRAGEFGGEPAPEEMTPERMVSLWERLERVKTIKQFEKLMVEASKKQKPKERE